MTLDKLIQNINIISVSDFSEKKEITGITNDSREVKSGSLYVAIVGDKSNGNEFIPDAVFSGAAAIVTDRNDLVDEKFLNSNNVVKIVVKNSRTALADISCEFYKHPSKKLKLVGITGSNGKTTTAFYVKNMFENAGFKTGLLGTISNIVGDVVEESRLTTPESHTINKYLDEMISQGITHCVMEVSSHSLALERVRGLDFDYAVLTNITSDHMDFHRDFENYFISKKKLFDNLTENATAIVNEDDPSSSGILTDCKANKITYGKSKNSIYRIDNLSYDMDGTKFSLNYSQNEVYFQTKLIGEFNAYNAACASLVGLLEGFQTKTVISGINSTLQVPGRFEVIGEGDKKVIIDYSHTADSLEKALKTVREIVKETRKIHTVFGCGGNRDKSKRPIMGEIADRLSDEIYVTSDNPRFEDPKDIINEILQGIKRDNANVIVDREKAIQKAICSSEENAVILIAGKGHEEYQIIRGEKSHFSDKELALRFMENCN